MHRLCSPTTPLSSHFVDSGSNHCLPARLPDRVGKVVDGLVTRSFVVAGVELLIVLIFGEVGTGTHGGDAG